ncbi:MAG TPA: septal ring lytic transglycosylase RlpA family protein [Candidatus Fraserbacteria bacterium]|nr:septal ring lytic transglycosylase RlpA family protein [Candidatus Fraserbacteria bacterium]
MRTILLLTITALLVAIGLVNYFSYDQIGIASWYGPKFQGRRTSSGERFDMNQMTAAHKSLPFGTIVRVVDLKTQRSVVVRINDRGPFIPGRIIDLSYAAAKKLGIIGPGTALVGLKIISRPAEKAR